MKLKSTGKRIFSALKNIFNFSWLLPDLSFFIGRCNFNRFSSWSVYRVHCWGTIFLISKSFQFFRKSTMLALLVFKRKMKQFLRTSCWVLLRVLFRGTKEFKNYFFNSVVFCNAVVIGSGIFQFTQAQVYVLSSQLFCIFTSLLLV